MSAWRNCSKAEGPKVLDVAILRDNAWYHTELRRFDKVHVEKLPVKLRALGIHPAVMNWIRLFLSGRTYLAEIGGQHSKVFSQRSVSQRCQVFLKVKCYPTLFLLNVFKHQDCITHSGGKGWNLRWWCKNLQKNRRLSLIQILFRLWFHLLPGRKWELLATEKTLHNGCT